MSIPAVEESWLRIDAWLTRHAPLTRATLRPPAAEAGVEAAERSLGVAFPPDLVASLRCHDGVEPGGAALELTYHGPLSAVADIVRSTTFLRSVAAEVREDRLPITLGIAGRSSDSLFVSCRPGPHHGQVGRSFEEDMLSPAHWPSLRHVLADFADALEQGLPFFGRTPLAVDGKLLWEEKRTVPADAVSPLTHATTLTEPESDPPFPQSPVFPNHAEGAAQGVTEAGTQRLFFVRTGRPRREPLPDQPDVAFAAGLSPAEMLRRLGAIPDTVRPRDRRQAQRAVESAWAAHRPLARAGAVDGWAYATIEGGAAQFARPEVLRALSAGTRVVVLTRQGPEVALTFAEDGVPGPEEDTRRVMSPREGNHAGGPWARRLGVDLWPGSTAAYTDFLAVLEEEFKIAYHPDEEGPTELTSALLLPLLDDLPEREPGAYVRDFDLAGLVERTPHRRLRTAVAAQVTRLAAETHLDTHPEVTEALDRVRRGLPVDCAQEDPLAVRMRTLVAEVHATRTMLSDGDSGPVSGKDLTAWLARRDAADALRAFLLLPLPVAAEAVLQRRLSLHWRDELAADLRGA
ncbi:SMI1/KNR4 family protein [Streptomyces sp. CA-179760]|uniref:SMI1/KNR4 family protein n=1 Tax=Streptomyces sp. CA-179760 TaxID=3240054 RepID=UPI003D8E9645